MALPELLRHCIGVDRPYARFRAKEPCGIGERSLWQCEGISEKPRRGTGVAPLVWLVELLRASEGASPRRERASLQAIERPALIDRLRKVFDTIPDGKL